MQVNVVLSWPLIPIHWCQHLRLCFQGSILMSWRGAGHCWSPLHLEARLRNTLADDMGPHEIKVIFHPTLWLGEFWAALVQTVTSVWQTTNSALQGPNSSSRLSLSSRPLSWQCLCNQMASCQTTCHGVPNWVQQGLFFHARDINVETGFPQTFDNWIQGLFKDFQGQQQQSWRMYFKAQPPLPPLLVVRSSHKILYCQMILIFLNSTMLVNIRRS